MTSPEVPLCICHHFMEPYHLAPTEERPVAGPCLLCRCRGFQPVSHKSSHVYQRSHASRVVRKRFDQLHVGDWVIVDHSPEYGLEIAVDRADTLLAQVTVRPTRREPAPEDRYRSDRWEWEADTDLGHLGLYPGQTMTMTVKKEAGR